MAAMKKLANFLSRNNLTGAAFAAKINAHPSTVSRILAGSLIPTIDLAYRIQSATGGAVKFTDWVSK